MLSLGSAGIGHLSPIQPMLSSINFQLDEMIDDFCSRK
jgi:hypothetical protein